MYTFNVYIPDYRFNLHVKRKFQRNNIKYTSQILIVSEAVVKIPCEHGL